MTNGSPDKIEAKLRKLDDLACACAQVLLSAEEFSTPSRGSLGANLSKVENRFATTYVFVARNTIARAVSGTLHSLSVDPEGLWRHQTVKNYVASFLAFDRRQREFFADRNTLFLNFDSLKKNGFAKSFIQSVFGFEMNEPEVSVNQSSDHIQSLLHAPRYKRERIVEFFGSPEIRKILAPTARTASDAGTAKTPDESTKRYQEFRQAVLAIYEKAFAEHDCTT